MYVSPEKLLQISSSFFLWNRKWDGCSLGQLPGLWGRQQSWDKSPWLWACPQGFVNAQWNIVFLTKRRNPLCTDSKWGLRSLSAKTRRLVWQSNETSLIPWTEFSILICYIFPVLHSFWWAATDQDRDSYSLKWEKSTLLIFGSWDGCFLSADCSYKWKQINRAISDWPS